MEKLIEERQLVNATPKKGYQVRGQKNLVWRILNQSLVIDDKFQHGAVSENFSLNIETNNWTNYVIFDRDYRGFSHNIGPKGKVDII